jgi:hypothetical protein
MKMPALCWTALKSGVSARPYALRIHPPNDTMIPEGLAEFKKLYPHVTRVAVAGDEQQASGLEAIEQFSRAAKELGMTVVRPPNFKLERLIFLLSRSKSGPPIQMLCFLMV